MDGSENPKPPHFGEQRSSLQIQYGCGAAWSTNDPANALQTVLMPNVKTI
jgi:hypothetical protein